MMGESITERIKRLATERQQKEQHPSPDLTSVPPPAAPLTGKEELRRARTHRLIEIGALTDQYFGTGQLTPEQVGQILAVMMGSQEVKDILKKAVG